MTPLTAIRHITLLWVCAPAALATSLGAVWFTNPTECGGALVKVRSLCEASQHANAARQRNTGCAEQQLVIVRPGHRRVVRDLLEHEPVGDNFHVATALRCVAAGRQYYLLLSLDTGGACETCETEAIMGLDGNWKRYGKYWRSIPATEQNAISKSEPSWRQVPVYLITNTVRDIEFEQ